jgi:hypothetical protein
VCCRVRQRAGLAHEDALVVEVQPRRALEGQTADARTGANHDGHPGAQVTASVTAERLRGIGGADHEDSVHTVERLGDVGRDRRQRGESLKLAFGLDPAALADRQQMVLMGMLCIQRDLMPLARPLVGDRQPSAAGPQHRDPHLDGSLRARVCSVVNLTTSHSGSCRFSTKGDGSRRYATDRPRRAGPRPCSGPRLVEAKQEDGDEDLGQHGFDGAAALATSSAPGL